MNEQDDLCFCGHSRGQHQHLLGTKIRYPCLQCTCADFRQRKDDDFSPN